MDDHQRTLALLRNDMTSETALELPSNNARENTLLGLPRELRDQIWSYVLDSKYENVNYWHPFFLGSEHRMLFYQTPSPRTTMLQVSRHFSEEGKHRLYQHSTFRVHCDYDTKLTLPIGLPDTHMIRNIELQVDHKLFLRKTAFRRPTDLEIIVQSHPREPPTQFIEQLEQFGSSEDLRAEKCTFYLNTISYNKEFLPVVIPVLHALKGFETLILKIAVCPPRFSSPSSAWLLSEPFKTNLEEVLGEGEFTDYEEGRCCLVFRPREYRVREESGREERRRRGRDAYEGMVGADGESEDGSVDSENERVDNVDGSVDS